MSSEARAVGDLISIPKGGGAIKGMGEKFTPDLHTGTGNFSVPISLPAGRNGFQPQLTLNYSTGSGNSVFGQGWNLGISGISRQTAKGIPLYQNSEDVFILSGAEDLVPVEIIGETQTRFRPRTEGLFARIVHYQEPNQQINYWKVESKDGLVSYYGTRSPEPLPSGWQDSAILYNPNLSHQHHIFAWKLTETHDPFGNRIVYEYETDDGNDAGHQWRQPLLKRIRYVEYADAQGQPQFLVTVTFEYEDRLDSFSDYRAGFEIRTTQRCKAINITTHTDFGRPVRRYEFRYDNTAINGVSHLIGIDVLGFDANNQAVSELPPLEFGYTSFNPQDQKQRDFYPIQGQNLPAASLANGSIELVDLHGSGLPDLLEMNGNVRYWPNLGNGRFGLPRSMADAPAGLALADAGVQLIDANGDGRTDLLVTRPDLSGYYALEFGAKWSNRSFQRYGVAPSFNLEDPEVRLIDLTGDGVTDVLRSGTRFECYFNDPHKGWDKTKRVERQALADFPNVNFSDPRVKWGDMSGDGLTDIVLVYDGNVSYWPNLGYGEWGGRLQMRNSPRLPYGYNPARILVGDVDGDGLADLIYVDDRKIHLWINQSGNAWSDEIIIQGTPSVSDIDAVRLTDLLGGGIAGVLWTRDAIGANDHYFFLDLTGGAKPYLLNYMDNHLGAVTEVSYRPSTYFYLTDQKNPETQWRTPLPFPVQVVERVTVRDALSGGVLTTEYRYHHGYWDGAEREFRGFGMVEQLDTEIFDGYTGRALSSNPQTLQALLDKTSFSPPLLTRVWFHQGPVGEEFGDWQELDFKDEYWDGDPQLLEHTEGVNAFLGTLADRRSRRDALRTLRGSILRSELYALDGSPLEGRPYTVTEHAYSLREEEKPGDTSERYHIFFPHSVAQRTTQWERGNDPMTSFSYTTDYDVWGQPKEQWNVACPQGWKSFRSVLPDSYLATITHTEYAEPSDPAVYMHDRVAKTTTNEIINLAGMGRNLQQVLELAKDPQQLRIIGQTVNYYDGEPFMGLPYGQINKYGALVRSESLVLTNAIFQNAYAGQNPIYLTPGAVFTANGEYPAGFVDAMNRNTLAGYTYYPATDPIHFPGYFAQTARSQYDFQSQANGRGLVVKQQDALGSVTEVNHDAYQLLPILVRDAVGLETKAQYDYRFLQPSQVIDPNGNLTEVEFTPSGLVKALWLRGKNGQAGIDVAEPSVRMEYHLRSFLDAKQPVYAQTIRRVQADSDPSDTWETIETREYSDGFGRLLQTRTQGEKVRFGDLHFGGGDTVLPIMPGMGVRQPVVGIENISTDAPNVTVSGWQRYDNKGRVVEKYEPFFAVGWGYLPPEDAQLGQKAILFYDPRGQVVRTLNPDGSEQRVVHGIPKRIDDPPLSPLDTGKFEPTPWQTYTYDANDNAGRTHANESVVYQGHWNTPSSAKIDALGRTVETVERNGPNPQTDWYYTRSEYDIQGNLLSVTDSLGRVAFRYTYDLAKHPLRTDSLDAGLRLAVFDAMGNSVEQRDAKGALILQGYDVLHRPKFVWARDGENTPVTLRQQIVYGDDATFNLPRGQKLDQNCLGKPVHHYDDAGLLVTESYDFKGNILAKNLQPISDQALLGVYNQIGANGEVPVFRVDWNNPPSLEAAIRTSFQYDALNRLQQLVSPPGVTQSPQRIVFRYNHAGALEHLDVFDGSSGERKVSVEHIAYNAKGQRTLIAYGNGVLTRYAYDPETFRLVRLRSEHFNSSPDGHTFTPSGSLLQDLFYQYDLAGNILTITDRTPGCGVLNNPTGNVLTPLDPLVARVINADPSLRAQLSAGDALVRRFEYDPIYRLISADGRESNNLANTRPWLEAPTERAGYNSGDHGTANQGNAPNLTSLYREEYSYDPAGNMVRMVHRNGNNAWSRYFGMNGNTPSGWDALWPGHLNSGAVWPAPPSNQLTHVGDGNPDAGLSHAFDANGNLVMEQTNRHFGWDYADRLGVFRDQVAGSVPTVHAQYVYRSDGQRVKKLVWKGANRYEVTVYVDGLYEFHRLVEAGTVLENNELHVMDNQSRIATMRLGDAFPNDGAAAHGVKYQFGDHLGSCVVVVSGNGAWINREEFFPYGEASFGSFGRKRYRYTGKERDEESGLNYHGARYYAGWFGRWINVDPRGPISCINLFKAFSNNPIVTIDPTGTCDAGIPSTNINLVKMGTSDGGKNMTQDAGTTTGSNDAGVAQSSQDAGSENNDVTVEQLSEIFPNARIEDKQQLVSVLNIRAKEFGLNIKDKNAVAHFLAQIGAESGLKPQRENMNYKKYSRIFETWPRRFSADSGVDAGSFVGQPESLGNFVYDHRMGNDAGQGYFYRGGGLIQTTGKDNYKELQDAINEGKLGYFDAGVDVVNNPDAINKGELSILSALYYFQKRVLNKYDGGLPSVKDVTKDVNGGTNGLDAREASYEQALKVLMASDAGK